MLLLRVASSIKDGLVEISSGGVWWDDSRWLRWWEIHKPVWEWRYDRNGSLGDEETAKTADQPRGWWATPSWTSNHLVHILHYNSPQMHSTGLTRLVPGHSLFQRRLHLLGQTHRALFPHSLFTHSASLRPDLNPHTPALSYAITRSPRVHLHTSVHGPLPMETFPALVMLIRINTARGFIDQQEGVSF